MEEVDLCSTLENLSIDPESDVPVLHQALDLPVADRISTVKALIEAGANCDQRNENGLTACECALIVLGDRELASEMIAAEMKQLSSIDRTFYVMIRRGSLRVFRLFLEEVKLEDGEVYEKVAKALIELSARRVEVDSELEAFLQYRLAEYAFRCLSGESAVGKIAYEWRLHFEMIANNWKGLRKKYRDQDYASIDNEFIHRIQTIHNHMYFVKDKRFLKHLPIMQTVFCLAMFVSICRWHEKFQMHKLVIDKLRVMQFLEVICKHLDRVELYLNSLQTKLKMLLDSLDSKVPPSKEQLMSHWMHNNPSIKLGENVLNKVVNGFKRKLDHEVIVNEIISFEIFEVQSNFNHKDCSTFVRLRRTYFRSKQLYSIVKCINHIDSLPIKTADIISDPVAAADVKRVIQVIGEAIKSTKNSPNVSKTVADTLEQMLTSAFPSANKYFREFFSHKYSLIKRYLYEQPEINSFAFITKFFGQVKMIFSLLFVCSVLEASRSLLGSMRRCKTRKQLQSFLQYIGDISSIEEAQTKHFERLDHSLRKMTEDFSSIQVSMGDKKENYDRLMHGMEVKSAILRKLSNCLISKWTIVFDDIRLACYGKADISTIHRMIQWNLMHYGQNEVYDAIKNHWKPDHDTLSLLEVTNDDTIIHNPSVMGGILRKIELRVAMIEEERYLTNSKQILEDLGQVNAPRALVDSLHRHLLKYYENIFFLDNKFKAIKQLFKSRKIPLDEDQLKRMRLSDEESLQRIYNARINDMRRILLNCDISSVEDMAAKVNKISDRILLALEYCQLELCEMLLSIGYFGDNFDLLKHRIPMISGRNFRNYLAHDSLSYNVLTESTRQKVLINALVMLNNPVKLFDKSRTKSDESFTFPDSERVLKWVETQTELANGIGSMDSSLVQQSLGRGGDLSGKFCTLISSFKPLVFDVDWEKLLCEVSQHEGLEKMLKICARDHKLKSMQFDPSNISVLHRNFFYRDDLDDVQFGDLDLQGKSIFHKFVLAGNVNGVLKMLKFNPNLDINALNSKGSSVFDIAVHLGLLEISKLILTKNPRISNANRELAIVNHLNDLLPQLFSKYVDRRLPPEESFIKIAVRADNITALEFIVHHLYHNYPDELKNQHFSTAISDAAYFNHSRIIQYLLGLPNMDFFARGHSALRHAIERRNWPIVKLLLDHGASPNWINKMQSHSTAFMLAVRANSCRILQLMKNVDRELYRSLEHPMSIAIANRSPKMIRFLQKMNFKLLDSNRILQTAIRCSNENYVDLVFQELDAVIDEWKRHEGLLGQVGQVLSRLIAIGYLEERESNSLTAVLQAIDVENWKLLSLVLDKSRMLRKMGEWFIEDVELVTKNGMSCTYGNREPIQNSGMLCECKTLLNRLKDCATNKLRIVTIDCDQYSEHVNVDCELASLRDTSNYKFILSKRQNVHEAIQEMTTALIEDSNDMIFGTIEHSCCNVRTLFVTCGDISYFVRLTSTEPPQPFKTVVNAGDKKGESPLHMMAIQRDSPQTISLLLENGANPIAINTLGQSPLHIALVAQEDYRSMLLLNHCIDRDLKTPDGTSALEVSNGQGSRPIHYAAMFGKFAAVQFLLNHKVNVRVGDQLGYHPACYAASSGFCKILRLFLEHDPTLIDLVDSRGQNLLHISTKREEEETILMLLEYDVSISAVDFEGKPPVEVAVGNANAPWLKIVLFYARINGTRGLLDNFSDKRLPVLHYAVFSNRMELLRALVEYEIDADLESELSTESLEVLRKVLTRTMVDLEYSALHVAVQLNFKGSVEFLMSCQAYYNRQSLEKINLAQDAIDLKGKTPLDYALEGADETMTNLLLNCE